MNALEPSGGACPFLDVGPVPRGSTAHGPARFGEQPAVSPHGDGVSLDAEALGDVVGADRVAVSHRGIMACNARLDKRNVRSYSTDMTTRRTTTRDYERKIERDDPQAHLTYDGLVSLCGRVLDINYSATNKRPCDACLLSSERGTRA